MGPASKMMEVFKETPVVLRMRLAVFAPARQGNLVPIEQAIGNGGARRRDLEDALARAERLLPVLLRPGGT